MGLPTRHGGANFLAGAPRQHETGGCVYSELSCPGHRCPLAALLFGGASIIQWGDVGRENGVRRHSLLAVFKERLR